MRSWLKLRAATPRGPSTAAMSTRLPAMPATMPTSSAISTLSSVPMLAGRVSAERVKVTTASTRSTTYTKERTVRPPPKTSMTPSPSNSAILRAMAAGAFSRPPRQVP